MLDKQVVKKLSFTDSEDEEEEEKRRKESKKLPGESNQGHDEVQKKENEELDTLSNLFENMNKTEPKVPEETKWLWSCNQNQRFKILNLIQFTD